MSEIKPHSFCGTPDEKCTMGYCDENGCVNRKRILTNPKGAGRKTTDRKANKTLSLSVTVIDKLKEEKSPSAVTNDLLKKHYNL